MAKLTGRTWERDFRAAAKADGYDVFRDHLKLLGLSGEPVTMMEATILMVRAMAAYHQIDGQPLGDFLALQNYNPACSPASVYMFTFDLCGRAFGRLVADPEVHTIDLADLYGHPWQPYKACGYRNIRISHVDWSDIIKGEEEFLEKKVEDDLRFDYLEGEVGFWFDDSDPKYHYVDVYDEA